MSLSARRTDVPNIAEMLVFVGQRLGQETTFDGQQMPVGEAAWWASLRFEAGPKAARLDAGGGNRWEEDEATGEVSPVPSDATGEAGTTSDPESLLHARYRALLGWLHDNADDLRRMLSVLLPPQPNTKVVTCDGCGAPKPVDIRRPKDLSEVSAAGWCRSCYRDDKHLQPIETDKGGTRYYKDHCRWCGGFKADHGTEPPLELLKLRHQLRRVAVADIERCCPHCRAAAKKKRKAS